MIAIRDAADADWSCPGLTWAEATATAISWRIYYGTECDAVTLDAFEEEAMLVDLEADGPWEGDK